MTDVAIRPILYFLIGLVVFGGVLQATMSTIMTGYVRQDTKVASRRPRTAIETTSATSRSATSPRTAPPLQRDTTGDMLKMYEEEDRFLLTYHVDPKTKAIRVPIDRAIEIVAKKGLPHRDTPAPTRICPTRSPRSKPYRPTP